MKKLFAIIALLLPVLLIAAGSEVTQTLDVNWQSGTEAIKTITFAWTADDSDHTVPATALTAANLTAIDGWFLYFVETDPGATAPTDDYDIELIDENGLDILGGACIDRDTADTERIRPLAGSEQLSIPIDGNFTFTLTNNSVNSAVGICKLYFVREP